MTKDLKGLGDLDIEEMDRRMRDELRRRNPNNQPEVTIEMWTLARLTRDDRMVRSVVYGVVTKCLTDDYLVGDIVCSPSLSSAPTHPGRCIYVTKDLRYECIGPGRQITIPEDDLATRLPDPDAGPGDIKRKVERGEL